MQEFQCLHVLQSPTLIMTLTLIHLRLCSITLLWVDSLSEEQGSQERNNSRYGVFQAITSRFNSILSCRGVEDGATLLHVRLDYLPFSYLLRSPSIPVSRPL